MVVQEGRNEDAKLPITAENTELSRNKFSLLVLQRQKENPFFGRRKGNFNVEQLRISGTPHGYLTSGVVEQDPEAFLKTRFALDPPEHLHDLRSTVE